jgi:hypothetical protein
MLAQALVRGGAHCDNAAMGELQSEQLVGGWCLRRWTIDYPDGRAATMPFGPDAVGLLVYAADGWMTATMSRARRTELSSGPGAAASAEARAQAFSEYLSYAGRWELRGADIVHHVEWSMNPALIGTLQVRRACLAEGDLELSAEEVDATSGRRRHHRISWQRARPHQVSGK